MTGDAARGPSRRDVVRSTLLLSVPAIVAGCPAPESRSAPGFTDSAELLDSLSYSRDELRAVLDAYTSAVPDDEAESRRDHLGNVGGWYLSEYDRSADAPDVAASIDATLEPLQAGNDQHERVFAAIQRDFETDALTPVLGWWFSTTEVHLCVITFLLEDE